MFKLIVYRVLLSLSRPAAKLIRRFPHEVAIVTGWLFSPDEVAAMIRRVEAQRAAKS